MFWLDKNLGYYFYFKPTLLILIGFLITKLNFKKFAHLFLTSFLVLTTINSLIFFKGYYPYQDNPKKIFYQSSTEVWGLIAVIVKNYQTLVTF